MNALPVEELQLSGVEHVNSHAVKCAVNCGTDIHRDEVTLQRYLCTFIMCYSTNHNNINSQRFLLYIILYIL